MRYLNRNIDKELQAWSKDKYMKPLLLRGARQVGKTSAVRHLAESFEYYVEIDLNTRHDLHPLFNSGYSPQQICQQLSLIFNTPVTEGRTLLFFDEIQSCPSAINTLRYFYEQMPNLHLIAAGSLLEFALRELFQSQLREAYAAGLAASAYSQLTDVGDETTGLVTADRAVVKVPAKTLKKTLRIF